MPKGSRAPKRKDGKHESFDQKEKRSRSSATSATGTRRRSEMRQTTDGYSLGY